MKSTVRRVLLPVCLSATTVVAAAAPAGAQPGSSPPPVADQIAQVKQATARFHDVRRARAAGYQPTPECVASPAGAMGIHYIRPALIDARVDLRQPENLLYVPRSNGTLRLVGVEYFVPDVGQPAPELFGRRFDGPMAGHAPGQPRHYDLHLWIWAPNPSGLFAPFNPRLTCVRGTRAPRQPRFTG